MVSQTRLEELARGLSCENNYCFYKEIVSHMDERNIIQAKLIIDLRFMKSKDRGEDIGRKAAEEAFIEEYSGKFAEVYDRQNGPGLSYDEIYRRVFGFEKVYSGTALAG